MKIIMSNINDLEACMEELSRRLENYSQQIKREIDNMSERIATLEQRGDNIERKKSAPLKILSWITLSPNAMECSRQQ